MAARRCYGTEQAIEFILEPGSESQMSDPENSDDETDEAHIPPERMKIKRENESVCDKVSDESYSCRSIDQNKDNKSIMMKTVTLRN